MLAQAVLFCGLPKRRVAGKGVCQPRSSPLVIPYIAQIAWKMLSEGRSCHCQRQRSYWQKMPEVSALAPALHCKTSALERLFFFLLSLNLNAHSARNSAPPFHMPTLCRAKLSHVWLMAGLIFHIGNKRPTKPKASQITKKKTSSFNENYNSRVFDVSRA